MVLLWRGGYCGKVQLDARRSSSSARWSSRALVLRERVVRPLQTLSNMLAALREGDFSIRARGADRDDALGLALLESNLLGETLRAQRLGAMEATALLRTVMAEIDVAIFAFDDGERAAARESRRRAAARAAGRAAARADGRAVGLADCLERRVAAHDRRDVSRRRRPVGGAARRVPAGRPAAHAARARRREQDAARGGAAGVAAARARAEPRDQQLARADQVDRRAACRRCSSARRARRCRRRLRRGLSVIGGRPEALVRFMSAYARLARLPAPNRAPLDVGTWVRRVAALETRLPVMVVAGAPATVLADGDQLDQLLTHVSAGR